MEHYAVSPSALKYDMACDARWVERRKYPPKPSGPSAIEGTHDHALLEICINDGLRDPIETIGKSYCDHEGDFTVDFERAKRVSVAISYLQDRKVSNPELEIQAEQEVDPGHYLGWDDYKGTSDVVMFDDDVWEIVDYKGGRIPVEPDGPQLKSYALGVTTEYAAPADQRVRLTIIQPRVTPSIKHHDLLANDLTGFANEVADWRDRAQSDNPAFNPGEEQCRWCDAKGGCKAFMNQALEGVGMGLQAVEVANQAAEQEPTQWSDEQLREFIEGIPLLKQAISAAEDEAMRRWKEGKLPEGLKAVEGRGSRQWRYEEDQIVGALKKMGVPKGVMFTEKLVSPAQAEKLYWEKRDGTRKSLSQRQLKKLENEFIERKSGKVQIVPQSDEREAVEAGVQKMFAPVEQPLVELPSWLTGE